MQKVNLSTLQRVSPTSCKYKDACDWLKMLWDMPTHGPAFMPCSNPCSIMRRDLAYIRSQPYKAGLKTDGVRFFLLAAWMDSSSVSDSMVRYAVLVDRACRMFEVQLPSTLDTDVYTGTLVDGELIADETGSNQFVAFDLIACNGYDYKSASHTKRCSALDRLFQNVSMLNPDIVVHVKRWMPLVEAVRVLQSGTQSGRVDGLILVHEHKPIVNGTDRYLFKWKPGTEHTVDLKHRDGQLYAYTQHQDVAALDAFRIALRPHAPPLPDDVIVEFQLHRVVGKEDVEWIATPIMVRDDKHKANHFSTVKLTLQNILEDIQLVELVA
jgi:hypothetical protein